MNILRLTQNFWCCLFICLLFIDHRWWSKDDFPVWEVHKKIVIHKIAHLVGSIQLDSDKAVFQSFIFNLRPAEINCKLASSTSGGHSIWRHSSLAIVLPFLLCISMSEWVLCSCLLVEIIFFGVLKSFSAIFPGINQRLGVNQCLRVAPKHG